MDCNSLNCHILRFLFIYCIRSISLLLFHIFFLIPSLLRRGLKRCIAALSYIKLKLNIFCFPIIISAISALTIFGRSVILDAVWNDFIVGAMEICMFLLRLS